MLETSLVQVAVVVGLGYIYAFVGGFTDAANAIATSVGSRVLTFKAAVLMAAVFNLLGGLTGTAVATTIGKGIIDLPAITLTTVAAGVAGAMIWSIATYSFGIPVSETHGLVGGFLGAGLATAGPQAIQVEGVLKVLAAIIISPLLGFCGAILLTVVVYTVGGSLSRRTAAPLFANLQRASAAYMAFSHGRNDAQKPMGVIALGLALYFGHEKLVVPIWVIGSCSSVAALATAIGGWRIVKTLGNRITALSPAQGFAAEVSGASVIQLASELGIPISTTHAISSAIVGVGFTRRRRAIRWVLARDILVSWLLTIPATVCVSWLLMRLILAMGA
jgi:inorganic phosphate transporter, PiT family